MARAEGGLGTQCPRGIALPWLVPKSGICILRRHKFSLWELGIGVPSLHVLSTPANPHCPDQCVKQPHGTLRS